MQVVGAVGLWLLFVGWGLASLAGTASMGPGSLLLLLPEKTEMGRQRACQD